MGLDIGKMQVAYLPRPSGASYDFAWTLAEVASSNGYMAGIGHNWGYFTQTHILQLLDAYAERQHLNYEERTEILQWLTSLPWDEWDETLASSPSLQNRAGGIVELHFSW